MEMEVENEVEVENVVKVENVVTRGAFLTDFCESLFPWIHPTALRYSANFSIIGQISN